MRRASPSMPRPPRGQALVSARAGSPTKRASPRPYLGSDGKGEDGKRDTRVRRAPLSAEPSAGVGASVPTARVPEAGMEANDTLVQAPDPNLLCPICINVLDNPLRTPCG